MKRKYLIILFVLTILFTGCTSSSSKKSSGTIKVNDESLTFNSSANYHDMVFYYDSSFESKTYLDRVRLTHILKDGLDLYVELSRSKCANLERCVDVFGTKYGNVSTMTINGKEWARMVDDSEEEVIIYYFVEHANNVYMIEMNKRGDISEFESLFIRSISFESQVTTE